MFRGERDEHSIEEYLSDIPDGNAELFLYGMNDGLVELTSPVLDDPHYRVLITGSDAYDTSIDELKTVADVQTVDDAEQYLESQGIVPFTHTYGEGPGNSVYAEAVIRQIYEEDLHPLNIRKTLPYTERQQERAVERTAALRNDVSHEDALKRAEEFDNARKRARYIAHGTPMACILGGAGAAAHGDISAAAILFSAAYPAWGVAAKYTGDRVGELLTNPYFMPDEDAARY